MIEWRSLKTRAAKMVATPRSKRRRNMVEEGDQQEEEPWDYGTGK